MSGTRRYMPPKQPQSNWSTPWQGGVMAVGSTVPSGPRKRTGTLGQQGNGTAGLIYS